MRFNVIDFHFSFLFIRRLFVMGAVFLSRDEESQNDSPTISSLFFQSASALFASSAYASTPSFMVSMGALAGTRLATWQSSQYRPPISSAGPHTPAQTEVAAPCGMVFHWNGALPSAASC